MWIARASARFHYRPIGFVHAQRDGVIAISLWVLAFLVEIGIVTGVLPVAGVLKLGTLNNPLEQLGLQLLTAAVALVIVLASMLTRRQPPKSAGWNRLTLRNGALLGLALGFLTLFLRGRFSTIFSGLNAAQLNALWFSALICLAEETVFRGFLQLRLEWWIGKSYGYLLTAGLFIVWRLPFVLPASGSLLVNLGITLVQGLLLGWVMRICGSVAGPAIYRLTSMWCNFL